MRHFTAAPVDPVQMASAKVAAAQAFKHFRHVGIRPAQNEGARQEKSAGIKVAHPGDAADAVQRAHEEWPKTAKWSVFGAAQFNPAPEIAGEAGTKPNWMIEDGDGNTYPGDGCFSDCADVGEFETPMWLDEASAEEPSGGW